MLRLLTVAAFVLPLALDTLALSASLGASGIPSRERFRAALILAGFEAVMPFAGFLAGSAIGAVAGTVSDYAAAAVLAAAGIFMLWPGGDDDDEQRRASLLHRARGAAIIGLGVGISLDELAIGFGGGLLRLPLPALAALIGLQAFLAAQLGMRLGPRLREEARQWAERVAGLLLIGAGTLVAVERIAGV